MKIHRQRKSNPMILNWGDKEVVLRDAAFRKVQELERIGMFSVSKDWLCLAGSRKISKEALDTLKLITDESIDDQHQAFFAIMLFGAQMFEAGRLAERLKQ